MKKLPITEPVAVKKPRVRKPKVVVEPEVVVAVKKPRVRKPKAEAPLDLAQTNLLLDRNIVDYLELKSRHHKLSFLLVISTTLNFIGVVAMALTLLKAF